MKKLLFTSILFTGLLASCKNDFDVTEDWKEIPVIYGLLDQSDSVQYIRVSKAFLGDGNALAMAGVYDSVNYTNQVEVKINELSGGNVINSFILPFDTSIAKPPGVFAYPKQAVYKLSNHQLNENYQYELVMTNNQSGLVCRAKTELVRDFSVLSPLPNQQINFIVPNSSFYVTWYSAVNGKRYNFKLRFWYTEINKFTGLVRERHIDWNFPDLIASKLSGSEQMSLDFKSKSFFTFLRAQLNPNDSLWRHVGKAANPAQDIDFVISVAGDDFATYLDANQPTNGPLQEKPFYTNIENGIGLFSSRYIQKNPALYNRTLTSGTIDSIYAGQYTYDLNFCSPNVASPYVCY